MHYRIDRDQTGKLSIPDGKKFDTLWQVSMGVFNLIFYSWLGVFVIYFTYFMLVPINSVFSALVQVIFELGLAVFSDLHK